MSEKVIKKINVEDKNVPVTKKAAPKKCKNCKSNKAFQEEIKRTLYWIQEDFRKSTPAKFLEGVERKLYDLSQQIRDLQDLQRSFEGLRVMIMNIHQKVRMDIETAFIRRDAELIGQLIKEGLIKDPKKHKAHK